MPFYFFKLIIEIWVLNSIATFTGNPLVLSSFRYKICIKAHIHKK